MKKLLEMVTYYNVCFITYIEFECPGIHVDQTSVDYIEPPPPYISHHKVNGFNHISLLRLVYIWPVHLFLCLPRLLFAKSTVHQILDRVR